MTVSRHGARLISSVVLKFCKPLTLVPPSLARPGAASMPIPGHDA